MTASLPIAALEGISIGLTSKRFELGTEPVRLGRGSACTIILRDPKVSRNHAMIQFEDGDFIIHDLGSTGGTWLDGQQVQEARLTDGSRIRLGDSEFVFQITQDAVATKMIPEDLGPPPLSASPPSPTLSTTPAQPVITTPDGTAPPPTSATTPPGKPKRRKLLIGCGLVFVLGLFACLAVSLLVARVLPGGLTAALDQILDRAADGYTPEDLALALSVPMDDERPQIFENLGRPDEFDIVVVEVEGGQVRRESWYYYGFGTRVDFVDGVIVWTIDLEPAPQGTIFPAWYDPTEFETGLTIEAATTLVAAASPLGTTPEIIDLSEAGEDLVGGVMLVGDQITLGFQDGRLMYVETIGVQVQERGE
jgi:pSer/pThr/pTyr-binding forkhead associated (FHA) protein